MSIVSDHPHAVVPGARPRSEVLLPPVIMEDVDPVMNPIPAVGEHTDAILKELGIDGETIAAWRHSGMV